MVKIRLKRMGNSHRPFYRIVVAKSDSARDSAAIEYIGTYDPLTKPSTIEMKSDRALHWLMNGAQPTETAAILLKRQGILDEFFAQRPNAKKKYGFLDKTTQAMTKESAVSQVAAQAEEAKVEEVKAEEVAPVEEAPVAEEAVAEEPKAEESAE
ncbi:30S ribosomal protein S16 [Armatimonadetes bacterium Uphvl-Ar1]|nr:30S ribosomal protein S16 [Armatimonadetes bacterium Uphvl-Ar1]